MVPQLFQKPDFCEPPVPFHRIGRHLQHFCGLLYGQATEKAHLHHFRFSGIEFGERGQGVIKFIEVGTGGRRNAAVPVR